MSELLRRPALELGRMVRDGEVSARELAEAALARTEAPDGALNAFTLVDAEGALAAADAIGAGDERPLAGVPFAVKDLFAPMAGLRSAHGSDLLGEWTPDYDYALVRRFREAGLVIVGKTATPEFGILPVTEPRRFGPTRNPWDLDRTTGGSSGGAAAAVAAGVVPVAHASDGGGSIRIPAACCGLVGLKPTRNRISRAPDLGQHFLSTDGCLSRTVADTAAMLDLAAGMELGDAAWAPPPAEPFSAAAQRDPGTLRVGLVLDSPIEGDVDPECIRGAREAADLLSSLGHEVRELPSPWPPGDLFETFSVMWAANVGATIVHGQAVSGQAATAETIEPLSLWLYETGQERSALDLAVSQALLEAFARGIMGLWADLDVMVTPALGQRPVRHGEIDPVGENPAFEFKKSGEFTPFTAVFNVTGQPAISLPLFQGDDGLPTGVQIVGPPAGEGVLLSLAAQLEAAAPWADRLPPDPAA